MKAAVRDKVSRGRFHFCLDALLSTESWGSVRECKDFLDAAHQSHRANKSLHTDAFLASFFVCETWTLLESIFYMIPLRSCFSFPLMRPSHKQHKQRILQGR